jgi:hypothetical protein
MITPHETAPANVARPERPGQIKMFGVYMLCQIWPLSQYLDPPTIRTRRLIEPVKSYPQRKKQKGSEPVYQPISTTLEAVS